MNHQLQAGLTWYAGSIVWAAGPVKPASRGSRLVMRRLALNPAATPAKTAAMPARGLRPAALYKTAATGGRTTYPASVPRLDMIPRKTIVGVSSRGGTTSMKALRAAPMNPTRSARPMPSMPTRTMPSGGKRTKLSTREEMAQ